MLSYVTQLLIPQGFHPVVVHFIGDAKRRTPPRQGAEEKRFSARESTKKRCNTSSLYYSRYILEKCTEWMDFTHAYILESQTVLTEGFSHVSHLES